MKIVDLTQGTPEWHEHRANYFNASEAPMMLGVSPYKSRTELLKEKALGIEPEIDEATQARFDRGHQFEEMARPWAEELIGDDLYPVVMVEEVGHLKLSASADGLTMDGSTLFEHKTLNAKLKAYLSQKMIPDEYKPQLDHQLVVSGAEKVLFMASAGNKVEMVYCWYHGACDYSYLINGWQQFSKDLKNYEHKDEAIKTVGVAPDHLPSLNIEVTGMVTSSNLEQFKETALSVIRNINTNLCTDQDFADAEKTVKWFKEIESKLDSAKEKALSDARDIEILFQTIDSIKEEARQTRLTLDKALKSRKESRKAEIHKSAMNDINDHINDLNKRIHPYSISYCDPRIIVEAMKGKRTISSLEESANVVVSNLKIESSAQADLIDANSKALSEVIKGYEYLFADLSKLVYMDSDAAVNTAKLRILEHKQADVADCTASTQAPKPEVEIKDGQVTVTEYKPETTSYPEYEFGIHEKLSPEQYALLQGIDQGFLVVIPKEEYERLIDCEARLDALEASGIDKLHEYEEAMSSYEMNK